MSPSTSRRLVLVLCSLVLSSAGFGQSVNGTIKGALTLSTGLPIKQALVLVSALDKGEELKFSAQTDASGYYIFSSVPPGVYAIKIQKDGYKTHEEPVVPVSADTTSEVNVKLTEGNVADKEVGDGSAVSILKVDRTDVSTSFTGAEIDALPIFRQNTSRYELLVPGAVPTNQTVSSEQNQQEAPYVSIGGQHFSGTSFRLDGSANRDPLHGIVVLNPSLASVSEVKVTTQNYSAEVGPATAGVVSVQTKSGTNTLHGVAFVFRQSAFGQASVPDFGVSSFLTSSTQTRSDFGGALGGPLKKDRLFVFGDYRGVRRSAGGTVLLTVPTKTVHDTCVGAASPTTLCDLSEYSRAGIEFKPNYPNGMLPNSSLSPQMLPFLEMVPLPNNGNGVTNNFTASGEDTNINDNFNIRADYVASGKLKVFGRYSFANFKENGLPAFGAAGGQGTNPFSFAGVVKDRNQGISAGFSYGLTSRLLTDFRFGFVRYNLAMDSLDAGTTPATQAGIDGLNLSRDFYSSGMPDLQLTNPGAPGLPIAGNLDFLRLGFSPAANSCNCPLREREQEFQFVSNWTKLQGQHEFRWGADIRYLQNYLLSSDFRRAGHLQFSTATTGFSLGDLLLGTVSAFDRAYNPTVTNAGERQTRVFFYGEDTWRITSRLTFNYGLRWEIYLPQSVTGSGAGGWLQLGSGAAPADDRFLVAGHAGTDLQGNVQTTLRNIAPRLGLAYLVNPTTVIRAGYGRAFDPGYGGSIFGIAATQSPPVGVIATVQNGFTVNSNANPQTVALTSICANGRCTVPPFTFSPAPFTIRELYTSNVIPSRNPLLSSHQQANLYALPHRLRLPTVDAWNVALQHALDHRTYFEISYVGNKGTHVLNDSALNQAPYYNLNQPTLVGYIAPTSSGTCQNPGIVNRNGDKFCKTRDVSRQSFQPWTSEVRYFGNDASNNYNSLQIKIRRQLSSGFSMLAAYTWAKVLDYDNIYYAIDPKVSHGVGNFDRTHSFLMTNTWLLPVGRGHTLWGDAGPVLDKIVGGWSLAAITLWSSGFPFTPTYLGCSNDIGGIAQYRPCRPNLVGAVHTTGNRSQYFTTTGGQPLTIAKCSPNPKCQPVEQGFDTQTGAPIPGETIGPWQRPGLGQIGDAGRNSLRGPGFFQADLAVAKELAITEAVSLRFRADAFNVFNRVNLANPATQVDSLIGGEITSLAPGAVQRQLQFSLRVQF
jgi:outer membrane receptor protein involved in Fe transport